MLGVHHTDAATVRKMAAEVAGVDVAELGPLDAEATVAAAVRLANAAHALAARAAERVGATGAHQRCGDRSAAHHLARLAGIGVGAARTALDTQGRLDELAATAAAVAAGDLSVRQAAAITDAASVDPGAEARLLAMAAARSLGDLEDECARTRAAATPDDEESRRRRARTERGCWRSAGRAGSGQITYRSTLEEIAEAWAAIVAFREQRFRTTPVPGPGQERGTYDNHTADGFLDMVRAATGAATSGGGRPVDQRARAAGATTAEPQLPLDGLVGTAEDAVAGPHRTGSPARPPTPAKVIFRIDWDAFVRGYPIEGENCDIAGLGPVPVSLVHDVLATGDPFLAAVVIKGVDVVSVAHLGRKPTAYQRTALEWLTSRCHAQGCERTDGLEIDHTERWADTKITLLALLDPLCEHHHGLKTHQNWALVPGRGTRPFVAPDDPRHPDRAGPVATDRAG